MITTLKLNKDSIIKHYQHSFYNVFVISLTINIEELAYYHNFIHTVDVFSRTSLKTGKIHYAYIVECIKKTLFVTVLFENFAVHSRKYLLIML